MKKSYEIDMCHGPLLGKLFIFALPLMGSGILELMFNAADIIVVGRFTGAEALAAVGATSTLITSLVYQLVQSSLLIIAAMFAIINLLVDIINSIVDPRITLE